MERKTERRPSCNSDLSKASAGVSSASTGVRSVASSISTASERDDGSLVCRLLKRAVAHLPLAIVSLLHVVGYKFHIFQDESDEELDSEFVRMWIWVTGIVLLSLTLAELFYRVWHQGEGPLYKCKTWRKFYGPQMHKLEGWCLLVLLIGLGKSVNVILSWAQEDSSFGDLSNQMVTVTVPVYRLLRWMTDAHDVSVQRTFKKHKDLKNPDKKMWAKEASEEREKYQRQIKVRLQDFVNLTGFQHLMVLLVLFHCFCYSVTLTDISLKDWYAFSMPTGYVLTVVLLLEFIIRFWAQGGELYFMPFLNRAEFGSGLIGVSFLFYSTWYEDAKDNPEGRFVPSGYLSALFLLIHRGIRSIGIKYDINGDFSYANTVAGVKAVQLFMAKFGDILEIPEQNVHIGRQDAWIHKAKLRPEAFQGLHVPFTVRDGLFEELYIRMPDPLTPLFVLRMKNLLIVFGPGDGLAEAGRLTERSKSDKATAQDGCKTVYEEDAKYWNYNNVVKAKSKLVDLVCKRVQPQPVKRPLDMCQTPQSNVIEETASHNSPRKSLMLSGNIANFKHHMRYHAKAIAGAIKRRLASIAKNTCQRVEVSISNVTIQYEDSEGCLGPKHATVGARLGCASLSFKVDSSLQCSISRAAIYVEPNLPASDKETVGSLNCPTGHSWKEPVLNLLRQNPKEALNEVRRFNTQERFRLWGFEGTDNPLKRTAGRGRDGKPVSDAWNNGAMVEGRGRDSKPVSDDMMRHRRMEQWPERRLVFLLLHMKLQAGTESGRAKLLEEEEQLMSWGFSKKRSKSGMGASKDKSHNRPVRSSWGIFESSPKKESEDEGESKHQWNWTINTGRCMAPVSLMVDYDQVQCLHRMSACSKGWVALDNAFRWRPNVSLIEDGGAEVDALERHSLARQWWIYAIHRVLAQQRLRPRILWLDAVWQARNCANYRALLAEASFLANKELGKESSQSKPDYRVQWLQELQVRLPLVVIVTCYKNREQRPVNLVPASKSIDKKLTSAVTKVGLKTKELLNHMSPKSTLSKSFISPQEELVRNISGHSLFLFDDIGDSSQPSIARSMSSESMTPMSIPSFYPSGCLEAVLPALDVKILCPGKAPRPVLLHAKWRGVAVTATKSDPGEEHVMNCPDGAAAPERSLSMFSTTITVEDFHVVSPEAGSLLLGGSRHICAVVRPVTLPPAPSDSTCVATQNEGKNLAFAFRGTAQHGKSGLADLHLPHMRIVIYEPLMLALQKFTKKAEGSASFDFEGFTSQRHARRVSIGKVLRSDGGGGCAMRNGRMGPFVKVMLQAVHTDSEQTIDELLKLKGEQADYIKNLRRLRQLVKNAQGLRRKFDTMSGLAGAVKEWRLDQYSGAIHIFQVGEYSKNELLVEEYQIRNFINAGSGASAQSSGSDVGSRIDVPPERLVKFEFNGFSDEALLPWHEDESQEDHSSEELNLEESAMWQSRAAGRQKKVKKVVKKTLKESGSSAIGHVKSCRTSPTGMLDGTRRMEAQHFDHHGHAHAALLPDARAKVTRSTWQSLCASFPCILPGALSAPWPSCCNGLSEVRAEDSLTIDDTNIDVIVESYEHVHKGGRTLGFDGRAHRTRDASKPSLTRSLDASDASPCAVPSCTGILQTVPRDKFARGWLDAESARWRAWLLSNT